MRRAASFFLRVILSAGIFIYVITATGSVSEGPFLLRFWTSFSAVIGKFASIPFSVLISSVALYVIVLLSATLRWQILLTDRGFGVSYKNTFKYVLIGQLFNNVMPSTLGGDIVKAYYIHRDTLGSKKTAVFTIFMDRVIGSLATLLVIFAGAVYLQAKEPSLQILVYAFIAAAAVGAAAMIILDEKYLEKLKFYRKLPGGHPMRKLHYAFFYYKKGGRKAFFQALAVSLFIQVCAISMSYIIMSSFLQKPLSYWHFVCIIPVANIVQGLPISFAGWGVGEAAYTVLFKMIAVTSEVAVGTSVSVKLIILLVALVSGLPVYIGNKKNEIIQSDS
ncbi:flippase-like domain-containing protein [bacterium]|nr:flippase-like domain-containing protein [bacterium]